MCVWFVVTAGELSHPTYLICRFPVFFNDSLVKAGIYLIERTVLPHNSSVVTSIAFTNDFNGSHAQNWSSLVMACPPKAVARCLAGNVCNSLAVAGAGFKENVRPLPNITGQDANPLCTLCLDGWTPSIGGVCAPCGNILDPGKITIACIILLIIVTVPGGLVWLSLRSGARSAATEADAEKREAQRRARLLRSSTIDDDKSTQETGSVLGDIIMPAAKVLLSFIQSLVSLSLFAGSIAIMSTKSSTASGLPPSATTDAMLGGALSGVSLLDNAGMDYSGLGCYLGASSSDATYWTWAVFALLPIIIILGSFIFWSTVACCWRLSLCCPAQRRVSRVQDRVINSCCCARNGKLPVCATEIDTTWHGIDFTDAKHLAVNSAIVLLFLALAPVIGAQFQWTNCATLEEGYYLLKDPRIPCSGSSFSLVRAIGISFGVLYLAFPIASGVFLSTVVYPVMIQGTVTKPVLAAEKKSCRSCCHSTVKRFSRSAASLQLEKQELAHRKLVYRTYGAC